MILTKLVLQNFRSYLSQSFDFDSGVSVVVGPNTAGKTNILEAIYLLSAGETFRDGKIEEMVNWGAEVGRVQALVKQKDDILRPSGSSHLARSAQDDKAALKSLATLSNSEVELEVVVTRGLVQGKKVSKRRLLVNGVGRAKNKFVGNLPAVCFRPEDMRIIEGSPGRRRNFLDEVLSQIDPEYVRCLGTYSRGVVRRNKVLQMIREGQTTRAALAFWDQLVLKNGEYVQRKRRELVEYFNVGEKSEVSPSTSLRIKSQESENSEFFGDLKMEYDISVMSPSRLAHYEMQEVASGHTLVGPHRDDFKINSMFDAKIKSQKSKLESLRRIDNSLGDNRNLAIYGSRGEQRLGVLWLKIKAMEYIESVGNDRPILLLDDIFSELDENNRNVVLELCQKQQTIITSADGNDLDGLEKGWKKIQLN